jgi:SAM-dependent methyltransferase
MAMAGKIAPRINWTVDILDPQPADRVLEIGCGHGIAVDLVARRLDTGRVIGLDRSAKMIALAERRNAEHVSAGRARFVQAAIESWAPGQDAFDAAFAINVIAFASPDHGCHAAVRRALGPGGRFCLCFQPPVVADVPPLIERFTRSLVTNGFVVERGEAIDLDLGRAACLVARRG